MSLSFRTYPAGVENPPGLLAEKHKEQTVTGATAQPQV
jgi:hypothetical protein